MLDAVDHDVSVFATKLKRRCAAFAASRSARTVFSAGPAARAVLTTGVALALLCAQATLRLPPNGAAHG